MTNQTKRNCGAPGGWRPEVLRPWMLPAALVLSQWLLMAQQPPTPLAMVDAEQMYAKLCAGCHGADARGTQHGPGLSENLRVRSRSTLGLRSLIRNGIPTAGMPPFTLPDNTLDALVAMVVSLNSSASETAVPGDVAAGKKFYFGQGQCDSCHMVFGTGQPLGPDLSDVGKEMTVGQIREALLQPDAQITPGYGLLTVHLRDGTTLRGFARSRTNFDIQLQDLASGLHSLSLDEVSAVTDETQSLMRPLKVSPDDLQNLIAYLSQLTGTQKWSAHFRSVFNEGRNRLF
jgi:putative heme-binding domain-containing protein